MLMNPELIQKLIFTDEKLFRSNPQNNQRLVRREKMEKLEDQNISRWSN